MGRRLMDVASQCGGVNVNPGFTLGLLAVLALILAGVKLAGYLTWSWWLVLAPLWAPWLILGVILTVLVMRKP